MDKDKKERLQELIRKNKIRLKQQCLFNNELLQDCLKKITDVEIIYESEETEILLNLMEIRFKIEYHHIKGSHEIGNEVFFNAEQKYYVIWDNADIPILKCSGASVLQCMDDLFAVDFDTYIISEDFMEIIHCDESDRLWYYIYK